MKLFVATVLVALLVSCGEDEPAASVFEELGLISTPSDVDDHFFEDMLERDRTAADAAASCMLEYGYEYQPWSSFELVAPNLVDLPPAGTIEYTLEYGYGIMFNLPQQLRTHPSAKQDPNSVYTDGLTFEQRMEYNQTLYGIGLGAGIRRETVDQDLYDEGGCLGRELRKDGDFTRANLRGSLQPSIQDYEDRANADPRLLDYDEAWSACMIQAGYSYASSVTARDDFTARHREIWATTTFPASEPGVEGLLELSTAERTELYSQQPIFDFELWESAWDEEIAVATQDFECQRDNPRRDVFVAVLSDFEDQFLTENQTAIEELRSS